MRLSKDRNCHYYVTNGFGKKCFRSTAHLYAYLSCLILSRPYGIHYMAEMLSGRTNMHVECATLLFCKFLTRGQHLTKCFWCVLFFVKTNSFLLSVVSVGVKIPSLALSNTKRLPPSYRRQCHVHASTSIYIHSHYSQQSKHIPLHRFPRPQPSHVLKVRSSLPGPTVALDSQKYGGYLGSVSFWRMSPPI